MVYYHVLTSLKQLLHILRQAGNRRISIDVLQELLILLETIEKGRILEQKEEAV